MLRISYFFATAYNVQKLNKAALKFMLFVGVEPFYGSSVHM